MESLLVLAEEEYLEPSKNPSVTGIMKLKTSKKDYLRVDTAQKLNRYAPEILLTFYNQEKFAEETKDLQTGGCSVTCYECSYRFPVRTVEKPEKIVEKRDFNFNKH